MTATITIRRVGLDELDWESQAWDADRELRDRGYTAGLQWTVTSNHVRISGRKIA